MTTRSGLVRIRGDVLLNALIGPGLNAEQATDQYRATLRGLREELSNGAGFTANTAGAEKNRAVTSAVAA